MRVPHAPSVVAATILLLAANAPTSQGTPSRLRFAITFPVERSSAAIDGRLLLMISVDTAGEPRQQVTGNVATAQVFGIDVDGWTIQSWYARCGEANSLGSEIVEFVIVDECDLGERSSPGAIAIVPWPGERLVLIGITAERGGVAASGSYYVRIHATP